MASDSNTRCGRSPLRIGAGASYAGDRIEPATDLAARANLDYLVYETLAERTIAMANTLRMKDPEKGYNELLEERFTAALPHCRAKRRALARNSLGVSPGVSSMCKDTLRNFSMASVRRGHSSSLNLPVRK